MAACNDYLLIIVTILCLTARLSAVNAQSINLSSVKAFIRLHCDEWVNETAVVVNGQQSTHPSTVVTCGSATDRKAFKVTITPFASDIWNQRVSWSDTHTVSPVNINPIQTPGPLDSTKLIIEADAEVNAFTNEDVLLECKVRGTDLAPDYIITWYHYDTVIDLSGNRVWQLPNGSLFIHSKSHSDSGFYSCKIQTHNETYTEKIRLIVYFDRPRWERMSIDNDVPLVTNVTVTEVRTDSLTLAWQEQRRNKNHKIMGYIIRYFSNNESFVKPIVMYSKEKHIKIDGMKPDSSYTIRVAAHAGNKMSFPIKVTYATKSDSVTTAAPAESYQTHPAPSGRIARTDVDECCKRGREAEDCGHYEHADHLNNDWNLYCKGLFERCCQQRNGVTSDE